MEFFFSSLSPRVCTFSITFFSYYILFCSLNSRLTKHERCEIKDTKASEWEMRTFTAHNKIKKEALKAFFSFNFFQLQLQHRHIKTFSCCIEALLFHTYTALAAFWFLWLMKFEFFPLCGNLCQIFFLFIVFYFSWILFFLYFFAHKIRPQPRALTDSHHGRGCFTTTKKCGEEERNTKWVRESEWMMWRLEQQILFKLFQVNEMFANDWKGMKGKRKKTQK